MRQETISAIAIPLLSVLFIFCPKGPLRAEDDGPAVLSIPTTLSELSETKTATKTGDEEQDSGTYAGYEEQTFPQQSVFKVLLRLVLSMIAIVALIFGTVYVLRRFAARGTENADSERLVQVIDRVNLDAKRSVYIVKVVDRLMVLGVGNENVTMLGEIRDESVVEGVRSKDFSFHLSNLFGRFARR